MTTSEPIRPGLLVIDKPRGVTSHDVVGRVRAIAGTRRVGHAGTLDPMATGLLIVALGRATRLLGHLALATKSYTATIRFGHSTDTDDADGEIIEAVDAAHLDAEQIASAMGQFTGDIAQVPSTYSAIKVDGKRAYELARAGQDVDLQARQVTVFKFSPAGSPRVVGQCVDMEVFVDCTTGTYVRALARDLGAALGVGAHLTALRRTRIGPITLAGAVEVYPEGVPPRGASRPPISDALRREVADRAIPVDEAVRTLFPVRTVSDTEAVDLGYGRSLPAAGIDGTYAAVQTSGEFLALLSERGDPSVGLIAKPVFVWSAH